MQSRRLFFIFSFLIFISCKRHSDKLSNDSSIASITFQAEMHYLDNRLFDYKGLSEKGAYYSKENELLDSLTNEFKDKIKMGEKISFSEQDSFLDHFEKTFKNSPYVDFKKYREIKKFPFTTISDIDQVKGYIKNCFVYILQDNNLLPFDSFMPLASTEKQTIKDGETFNYMLTINAYNSEQPFEWYLVKDNHQPLTKENIVDTLTALDRRGIVFGKTKKYKKGANNLQFLARLKTSRGDIDLPVNIRFFVK